MTQTINLRFDNPQQIIGTLTYIWYKSIIIYCKGLFHLLPASRKADSLACGENSYNFSLAEGLGE